MLPDDYQGGTSTAAASAAVSSVLGTVRRRAAQTKRIRAFARAVAASE